MDSESDRYIPTREIPVDHKISADILNYISRSSATYYKFVPIGLADGVLEMGMMDPNNLEARDALQFIATKVGLPFKIYHISQESYDHVIASYEGLSTQVTKALSDLDVELKTEELPKERQIVRQAEAKIIE